MSNAALAELETAQYPALDAISRLPLHDPRRVALQTALDKSRMVKSSFLRRRPDVLRKGVSGLLSVSLPVPGDEIVKAVREATDRAAEDRRLRPVRRRYRAPEELRGQSLRLVDGSVIKPGDDGVVEVAVPAHHPAGGDSAVHSQLASMNFTPLPDAGDEADAALKAARCRPIVGDEALVAFLSRNSVAGR
jgi:hypothetical protein